MKRFLAYVLPLLGVLFFLSCEKAPSLKLTGPTSFELSVDGSTGSIAFTANRDWTISASDSWVSVSPTSGVASDGPVTVTVRCNANTTYDDRFATVTINMEGLTQTVTITQPANLGVIVPTQDFTVKAIGGLFDVEVQSNTQYSVSVDADWISQVDTKGLTTDKLTFKVEGNKAQDGRSASITISGGGTTQVVTIMQEREYCLTFDIITGGYILWKSDDDPKEIQYSKNGQEWVSIVSTQDGEEIPVSAGDAIRIRGDNFTYRSNSFAVSDGATFHARGSIMSLLFGEDCAEEKVLTDEYVFSGLFKDCEGIVTAPELPATILTPGCYGYMFRGCTSLVEAPVLPAETLTNGCYSGMFSDCTSLESAPRLPATILDNYCYNGMFEGCSSLGVVQDFPKATLAQSCCEDMFSGCISLKTAPELPSLELANDCYRSMFSGCASLVNVPVLPAKNLAEHCYINMFKECTSLVEPPDLPAMNLAQACYAGMFSGCTSLMKAPELPAIDLANSCYGRMFEGCTSLKKAPSLPATLLANNCYYYMFANCWALQLAPELPATTVSQGCYEDMFFRCESLVEAPELPATTLAAYCYYEMFEGCISLKNAPSLPATTLSYECYYRMFARCTSLQTAPELLAPTLVSGCYGWMFSDCHNIDYIKCLAIDLQGPGDIFHGYCENWLNGTSPSGVFVKNPSMTSWRVGPSGIPAGWTVQDAEL